MRCIRSMIIVMSPKGLQIFDSRRHYIAQISILFWNCVFSPFKLPNFLITISWTGKPQDRCVRRCWWRTNLNHKLYHLFPLMKRAWRHSLVNNNSKHSPCDKSDYLDFFAWCNALEHLSRVHVVDLVALALFIFIL